MENLNDSNPDQRISFKENVRGGRDSLIIFKSEGDNERKHKLLTINIPRQPATIPIHCPH